ncbi:mitochondrial metalloendopeptidase OMA1-like [Fagus crenata]
MHDLIYNHGEETRRDELKQKEALQRVEWLRNEQVWSDLWHDLESIGGDHKAKVKETLRVLKESEEGKWFKEDKILYDKWIQWNRKKDQGRVSQAVTSHLEGKNWEV